MSMESSIKNSFTMNVTDRTRKTVWLALAFRLLCLGYEIIMLIVILLYFIPMLLSQKVRNKQVDGFMSNLSDQLNKPKKT